jgi:hypothetical protein
MKKTLLAILLAAALTVIPVGNALAATSADVTVTADPLYLSITNTTDDAGTTWLINGLTGSGQINVDTTYYSNPLGDTLAPAGANVVDGECYFTVTNAAGADTCDLTVTWSDFAGGDADMTNSNTGSNGATSYGAYCWYSGMTYASKVIVDSSSSAKMYDPGLAAGASLKWGVEITTRQNAWTGGTASTSILTITASAD